MDFNKFSCAGFFIFDPTGQKILLGKSSNGYLSAQKGGIERKIDDSLFACACRETLEESGIDPKTDLLISKQQFIEYAKDRPNVMYWMAKLKQPRDHFTFDPKELVDVSWYTINDESFDKLKPQRREILNRMFTYFDAVEEWYDFDSVPSESKCNFAKKKFAYENESRLMVGLLRHHLNDFKHDAMGYVQVDELIAHIMQKKAKRIKNLNLDIVKEIVEYDAKFSKQRMDMRCEDGDVWFIAANQGHSGDVEIEMTEVLEAFPHLIHGTEKKFQDAIATSGLQKMQRTHIHCIACDPNLVTTSKVISGFKKQSDVIVVIDMARTMKDGMKWYISKNKVVLTEGPIDPKYLTFQDLKRK